MHYAPRATVIDVVCCAGYCNLEFLNFDQGLLRVEVTAERMHGQGR